VTERRHILIVDDEPNVRESLKLILGREYEATAVPSSEEALEFLGEAESGVDLILLDVMMPGIDGIGLLEKLRETEPELPVVMLTASSGVPQVVRAMKLGAVDYLNKPYDVDELLERIEKAFKIEAKPTHKISRPGLPEKEGDFGSLIGKHPLMNALFEKITQISTTDVTVLITGESGVGKEIVAKEIHRRGARSAGPFVAINCAAISDSQIEAELFGHEAGVYGVSARQGRFAESNGGTLFLDEICELTPVVQAKILRFIESQELTKVGGSKPEKINTRIVAATNSDLEQAVEQGKFRKDLYFRLHVVNIHVPALRERIEDLEELLGHFMEKLQPLYQRTVSFSKDALEVLKRYSWPGNVRELENVTESLVALCLSDSVTEKDLPKRMREQPAAKGEEILSTLGFEAAEKAFETDLILKALRNTNWVQTRAAEMLGISRRILKYKMDKLGIPDSAPSES